ncbi:hypothetical protein RJ640_027580 [Escallonia rubra]|uniref:CID domain-containing protein n=1 Tax=Escallonia rubra TaxID=112253 RepID=A0AA88U9Q8_9ASTE|nr:hypothetical protein RJ640_027580 [Escallonia rubra]
MRRRSTERREEQLGNRADLLNRYDLQLQWCFCGAILHKALSHWCIFHRSKAELVVATWAKQFHDSEIAQKVPLLYLANDILQNSKRKGNEFVTEFWKVLPVALKDLIEKAAEFGWGLERGYAVVVLGFKPLQKQMHQNVWVENADRWVVGFLEMFEEGCHKMETAIRDRVQERLRGQHEPTYLLPNGNQNDDGEETEYYYDDDKFEDDELLTPRRRKPTLQQANNPSAGDGAFRRQSPPSSAHRSSQICWRQIVNSSRRRDAISKPTDHCRSSVDSRCSSRSSTPSTTAVNMFSFWFGGIMAEVLFPKLYASIKMVMFT